MTPAVGQVYQAPWGRYAVARVDHPDGDGVVLRDLGRPGANVLPRRDRLGVDYQLVADAPTALPANDAPACAAPPAPVAAAAAPAEPRSPPSALSGAPRVCWDYRRTCRVLWATDDPAGPEYCSSCLAGSRPAHVPTTGTWRPPAGTEDSNPNKAEIGSFARPSPAAAEALLTAMGLTQPTAKPKRAPTTRDLWAELTAGVDRG